MTDKMEVPAILDDKRTIRAIWFEGENAGGHSTDEHWNASKIVAYGEPGEYCMKPWFAVYDHAGNLSHRVPAQMVVVVYAEGK